jgi:mRNA interferase MazF
VVKKAYVPDRGDAVWLSFDPQLGREQAGWRPALVISPATYNGKVGLGLFCPISNQAKGYAWEVPLPPGGKATGVVLSDQVKSLDWRARKADFICRLPADVLEDVLQRLAPLLDPDEDEDGS